jgi:hypothetical protein
VTNNHAENEREKKVENVHGNLLKRIKNFLPRPGVIEVIRAIAETATGTFLTQKPPPSMGG